MTDTSSPLHTLDYWLHYQQGLHTQEIALGLARVREVWRRLGARAPAHRVITVGGTNGKGSTVAMLEAMLRAAGLRVGCYTSPHLLRYNERVRIDGEEVADAIWVRAFERIEVARAEIGITYFEFGTLAALELFADAELDAAILEVGMGGRLDAVNIIDADLAVITTVDLDHQDWLGTDRDSIGREKAGIARRDRPAIVGERVPPLGLLDELKTIGARIERLDTDFFIEPDEDGWRWRHRDGTIIELPRLPLAAPAQYQNAAAAVAVLHAVDHARTDPVAEMPKSAAPLTSFAAPALRTVRIPARLQQLPGMPFVWVDVGHNPQAARSLAEWLDADTGGVVHAVYGALGDKDIAGVLCALGSRVTHWYLADLSHDTPRGLSAESLQQTLHKVLPEASSSFYRDVGAAFEAARAQATAEERILAFGSFFVAAAVLRESQA